MTGPILTLCLHEQLRGAFLSANRDALKKLARFLPFELLVWGKPDEATEDFPVRYFQAGECGYNQAMQALWRHARSPVVLTVSASMRLQPESVSKAAGKIAKGKAIAVFSAPSRWRENTREMFLAQHDAAPLLMQREAACRFVRATEGGLLCNWNALAQLEEQGEILAFSHPLAPPLRPSREAADWRFDVRNAFFEAGRPERYCGQTALYDTTTLERYVADAEQFILNWPAFGQLPVAERRALMFAKRRRLYEAAMQQALADGEETLALHFATRLRVTVPVSEEPKHADKLRHPQLWDLVSAQHQPLRDLTFAITDAAVAEQIRLFYDIFGEGTRLYLERCPQLETLAEEIGELATEWLSADELHEKAPEPNELVIFYSNASLHRRQAARPDAAPGRQISMEQLSGWLGNPLHAML